MSTLKFSVVICTYNRAQLVRECLPTVLKQAFDPAQYEVIVVDNNSSDNVREVVAQMQTAYPNLHYFFEGTQGLSHARNHGWRVAKGRYVAYLDDECKVPVDWLTHAGRIIEQHAPLLLGGDMATFFIDPPPDWWRDAYTKSFYNTHGGEARWLINESGLFGGNMFFLRDALAAVDGFDPSYGMNGDKIYYGEEDELIRRLKQRFPDRLPYYDPQLCVSHVVRLDKLSLTWPYREIVGRETTYHALFRTGQPYLSRADGVRFQLYASKEIVWQIAQSFLYRDKQHYPYWQNHFYENEVLRGIAATWGHLQAHRELNSWKQ